MSSSSSSSSASDDDACGRKNSERKLPQLPRSPLTPLEPPSPPSPTSSIMPPPLPSWAAAPAVALSVGSVAIHSNNNSPPPYYDPCDHHSGEIKRPSPPEVNMTTSIPTGTMDASDRVVGDHNNNNNRENPILLNDSSGDDEHDAGAMDNSPNNPRPPVLSEEVGEARKDMTRDAPGSAPVAPVALVDDEEGYPLYSLMIGVIRANRVLTQDHVKLFVCLYVYVSVFICVSVYIYVFL